MDFSPSSWSLCRLSWLPLVAAWVSLQFMNYSPHPHQTCPAARFHGSDFPIIVHCCCCFLCLLCSLIDVWVRDRDRLAFLWRRLPEHCWHRESLINVSSIEQLLRIDSKSVKHRKTKLIRHLSYAESKIWHKWLIYEKEGLTDREQTCDCQGEEGEGEAWIGNLGLADAD